MRLSVANLGAIQPGIARYGYDRDAQAVGIVHFGIGAFHRAHQAWYTDRAMDGGDRNWAITGVSLRSAAVAEQLEQQDGLYTLAEKSGAGEALRLIGAVRNVLVASHSAAAVETALASPSVHIVSLTITEKGYCRADDGSLDFALAGSGSAYALISAGLRRRKALGLPGLTLLCCDNLADNGAQLQRLMEQYLERMEPGLLGWFRQECSCPATMVDRIVPATTPQDRDNVARQLGLEDAGAIVTEPFSQWVIEDRFAGPRPGWETVGAELVGAVAPYEAAKLRMLNGAHSLLAYCGLQRGHQFVHQAVADPELRMLAERLMLQEAAPTIAATAGQNLPAYAAALLDRFANPALNHRLIQIAMDGTQKIPQRWLETLAANRAMGRDCPAIMAGLRAWFAHSRGDNGPPDDPLADRLNAIWQHSDADTAARRLFGADGPFAANWQASGAELAAISS